MTEALVVKVSLFKVCLFEEMKSAGNVKSEAGKTKPVSQHIM